MGNDDDKRRARVRLIGGRVCAAFLPSERVMVEGGDGGGGDDDGGGNNDDADDAGVLGVLFSACVFLRCAHVGKNRARLKNSARRLRCRCCCRHRGSRGVAAVWRARRQTTGPLDVSRDVPTQRRHAPHQDEARRARARLTATGCRWRPQRDSSRLDAR